jgi:hypothetical protein
LNRRSFSFAAFCLSLNLVTVSREKLLLIAASTGSALKFDDEFLVAGINQLRISSSGVGRFTIHFTINELSVTGGWCNRMIHQAWL